MAWYVPGRWPSSKVEGLNGDLIKLQPSSGPAEVCARFTVTLKGGRLSNNSW